MKNKPKENRKKKDLVGIFVYIYQNGIHLNDEEYLRIFENISQKGNKYLTQIFIEYEYSYKELKEKLRYCNVNLSVKKEKSLRTLVYNFASEGIFFTSFDLKFIGGLIQSTTIRNKFIDLIIEYNLYPYNDILALVNTMPINDKSKKDKIPRREHSTPFQRLKNQFTGSSQTKLEAAASRKRAGHHQKHPVNSSCTKGFIIYTPMGGMRR